MTDNLQFLVKVLLLSVLISALLKYVGPFLALPVTNSVSLVLVLSPALLMAGWLIWQQSKAL